MAERDGVQDAGSLHLPLVDKRSIAFDVVRWNELDGLLRRVTPA